MKKRATLYSLYASAIAVCGLVLAAAPASASIHNTPGYSHIVNAGSGKCIDASVPDDQYPYDSAQQWRCLNTTMEEWTFQPVNDYLTGRTDLFRIVNNATGECLFAESPESRVRLRQCNQYDFLGNWFFGNRGQDSAGSYFQLVNQYPFPGGECLDLENGDPSDGVPMQTWTCNANTYNQRWRQL